MPLGWYHFTNDLPGSRYHRAMIPRRMAIAAVLVAVAAANLAAQQAPPPPPLPVGQSADVPLMMRGPQPAVQLMVNGQGPFLFGIDTAASGFGRADTSLVTALALPQVGEARAGDGSGAPARVIPIVRAERLSLAGLSWGAADLASRDYNTSPGLPPISGVLGLQAFAGMLVTIDMPAMRLRLVRGELPPADGKTVLALDRRRPIPAVEIDVAGHKRLADIDTGNIVGDGPTLPASLIDALTFAAPPADAGTARTVTGAFAIRRGQLKGTIAIGGLALVNPAVLYSEGIERTNLGMAVLKNVVMTFDMANARVKLESR